MAQIGYGMLTGFGPIIREAARPQRLDTSDLARHELRRCTHCGWWRLTADPVPGRRIRKKKCSCIREPL